MDKKLSFKNLEEMLNQLKEVYDSSLVTENYGESSTRPPYQGSYGKLVEVCQNEFSITREDDSKPVLATYGLGSCVAMLGWSPEHKVGFLTHYDALTDLSNSFASLLYRILQQLEGKASEFDVRIIGGQTGQSEQIIDFLKKRLNVRQDIKMKLIEEETGGYISNRSIALDTRTGEVFSYDPKLNPQSREITELMTLTTGFKSLARLAYAQKRA